MEKLVSRELISKYTDEFSQKNDDPIIPFYIGILHLELLEYQQALSWFEKSFDINKTFAPAHFFYAAGALCIDKYDVAKLEFDQFLKYSKDPFSYYNELSFPFNFDLQKLFQRNFLRIKQRRNILPDDINTAYLAGLTYALWGHTKEALFHMENFAEDTLDARFLMVMTELYMRSKNTDKAIDILKRLHRLESDSLSIALKLSDLYLQIKDYGTALPVLQRAFELNPMRPQTLVSLAIANRELGRNELAAEILMDALFLDDKLPQAWFEFGILYEKSFNFTSAVSFFEKALSLNKDYGQAYYHIGLIHKRQGQYLLAVPAFYQALEGVKNKAVVHYHLGESLMLLNQFEEGALEFIKAIKIDQKDVYAYLNLGRCLSKAALYEDAASAFKQALAIQPDFIEPHYYLGLNDLKRGNLNSAKDYLTFFVLQKPQDTYAHFTLGNVYMGQGDYESAVNEYMEAIGLYPDHPYARFNLAASYACAGNYEDAQNEFTRALAQHPPETEEEMILFAALASYQSILQRLAQTMSELRIYFRRYNEANEKYVVEEKIKNRIAELFKKVMPEKIAEDLILAEKSENDEGYEEQRFVSVLFCDIRGYTDITERSGPSKTMRFLNDYYRIVSKVIKQHSGTLLYFQGDAQMVIFGAPENDDCHALHAVLAAIDIKKQISLISDIGDIPVEIAVGVATGDVAMGFINDGMRIQYTAIGDPVNIASRLQVISKEHNSAIMLTEKTYSQIKDLGVKAEFVDSFKLKGLTEAVKVYRIDMPYEFHDKS